MKNLKIGALSPLRSFEKISSLSWNSPLLSKIEEISLFEKYKENGDRKAFEKIINAHLRLIYKIISKYKSLTSFDQEDLFSHGYIGLSNAVNKYDYKSSNARFCSYCPLWIAGEVKKYIYDNESIVKKSKSSEFKKISYGIKKLIKNTIDEVKTVDLKKIANQLDVTYDKTLKVYNSIYFKDISWDPINDEDDLFNTHSYNPFNKLDNSDENNNKINKIKNIVSSLKESEKKLFNLRFIREKKLKDIANVLGISIEGTRQMQERCLKKIKYQLSVDNNI